MMRRLLIGLVVLAGFWLYNGGYDQLTGNTGPGGGDAIVDFANGDAEMDAATDAARATLPLFLKNNTDSAGNAIGNTSVKVAFDIGGESSEVIWVSAFAWDGDTQFSGRLANQPNFMGDLNVGDEVEFTIDMINDWAFMAPDGTMWGHYTTRVIVPQLDAETATALSAVLSTDPVPSDWN